MPLSPAMLAVALYAGLNGLILVWLGANVGRVRGKLGIGMGDGGNLQMVRAMRGQANFVEYAPFCLIELALMAAIGAPALAIHFIGALLTVGRLMHAWHFVQADAPGWQRAGGAGLTILAVALASVGLIGHALFELL